MKLINGTWNIQDRKIHNFSYGKCRMPPENHWKTTYHRCGSKKYEHPANDGDVKNEPT